MTSEQEAEELSELRHISEELSDIRDRTSNPRRLFFSGVFYGAGILMGGIVAVAVFGWVLSLLGIIPGFADVAEYLHGLLEKLPSRS